MHLRPFGGGGGIHRDGCVVTKLPQPVEPIKLRKRRSLSISPGTKKQRVASQAGCLFLKKLPVEVRILIYRHVFKFWGWSERIHILRNISYGYAAKESLSCTGCRFSSDEDFEAKQLLSIGDSGDPLMRQQQGEFYDLGCCLREDLDQQRKSESISQLRGTHLSLFLTCRIIYSEAIDLLYSSFSFDAVGLYAAYSFLSLVPLQRLQQIPFLQISEIETPVAYYFPENPPKEWYPSTKKQWIRVCSILKAAQSLRSLKIKFSEWQPKPCSPEQEERMLAPLIGIRVPKDNFLIHLTWFYESEFVQKISASTCTVQRAVRVPFGQYPRRRDLRRDIARPSTISIMAGWVCAITGIIVCGPCIAVICSIDKLQEVRKKQATTGLARASSVA